MTHEYDENYSLIEESESATVEEALDKIGNGRFQWILLLQMAWAVSSDTVEIVGVSFVLPVLECQFGATSLEKGVLNGSIFIGMMFGGIIWGSLGDSMGRKKILSLCLLVNGVCGIVSTLVPAATSYSLILFIILRCLSGAGVGGSYPVAFSYLVELQPTQNRGRSIGILCACWMLAGMTTASLAWALVPYDAQTLSRHSYNFMGGWRLFLLLCTLPALSSSVLIYCFIPESPRFLLLTNQKTQAVKIINNIASINRSTARFTDLILSSSTSISASGEVEDGELTYKTLSRTRKSNKFYRTFHNISIQLHLMFSRTYRRSVSLVVFVTFSLGFGYYGLLLWLPELYSRVEKYGGSICNPATKQNYTSNITTNPCDPQILGNSQPYWEALIVNAANLPGNIISILLIETIGRKLMLSGSMLLTAFCIIFIPFLHSQWHILAVTCAFGGVSAAGWNALTVVSTEVVPTEVRSSTIGLAGGLSRLGSVLANLIFGALLDVTCALPLVIGGGMLVLGAISGLALPNTVGRRIN